MIISGVAIGQWNQVCNKKEGVRRTSYKIHRAIVLGKMTHNYPDGSYIVRYYDLNILVNYNGYVMTVWRDTETKKHVIKESRKLKYDERTTHKQNISQALIKHRKNILKVDKKIKNKNKKSA